jgi:hypothetical protein
VTGARAPLEAVIPRPGTALSSRGIDSVFNAGSLALGAGAGAREGEEVAAGSSSRFLFPIHQYYIRPSYMKTHPKVYPDRRHLFLSNARPVPNCLHP